MTELLPCPFCGTNPFVFECNVLEHPNEPGAAYNLEYSAKCNACGIEIVEEYRDELTKRWNTRAPAQGAQATDIARLDQVEKTLWLFREFVTRNASQWVMGAGDHHHPMWALVAETLGDSVGYMPDSLTGDDWRFVQPLNRDPLPAIPSTDGNTATGGGA